MILIILGSFLEGLGGFLMFILMCVFVVLIMQVISYLTKITFTRHGRNVVSPTDFPFLGNALKSGTKQIYNNLSNKIKTFDIGAYKLLFESKVDKVEKIKELQRLKEKGIITQDEFENLKSQIISL
jgi:hypothetical protein